MAGTIVFALILAACSGGKKEHDHNAMESSAKADTSKIDAVTGAEIRVFENVDMSVNTQINGFLTDYFSLNQSLIEDNPDAAKAAARKLSQTLNKFNMSKLAGEQMDFFHAQLAKLNQGLKGINQGADIEETRIELATVSEAMYALVKAYHPNESALYYQFCPMAKNGAGANWLSNTKELVNPYMGQRMLKCGKTQETL